MNAIRTFYDFPFGWATIRHGLPALIPLLERLMPPEIGVVPSATIDRLIVNSPYEEPASMRYDRTTRLFDLEDGRRPAGYVGLRETPPRSTIPASSVRFRW